MELIIDAKDLILGRFASYVAKQALLGATVHVVNSELAIISGRKANTIFTYKDFMETGQPFEGPHLQRKYPDKFVRRAIRGMLPYKQEKGRAAFERITCHLGVPAELAAKPKTDVAGAHVKKLPNLYYITIAELCKEIGGYHG